MIPQGMTSIRGLVEVVLVVEDIDRSVAFYRDTLRLEPISPPELPVKFLRIGPQRAGVPQQVVLIPRQLVQYADHQCVEFLIAQGLIGRISHDDGADFRAQGFDELSEQFTRAIEAGQQHQDR